MFRVLFSMGREVSGRVAAPSDACPRSPLRGTRAATCQPPDVVRFLPLIIRADVTVLCSYRMKRPVPVGFRMHGIELRVFTRVVVSIAVMVVAVNWHVAVLRSRGRCPQRADGLCGGQRRWRRTSTFPPLQYPAL